MRKCSDPDGHKFTPDLEYDPSGRTHTCDYCGEAEPYTKYRSLTPTQLQQLTEFLLLRFPREQLRAVARRLKIPRGKNAADTLHNLASDGRVQIEMQDAIKIAVDQKVWNLAKFGSTVI